MDLALQAIYGTATLYVLKSLTVPKRSQITFHWVKHKYFGIWDPHLLDTSFKYVGDSGFWRTFYGTDKFTKHISKKVTAD